MIQDRLSDKKALFAARANTELRAQRNTRRVAVLLNGNLVNNVRTEQFGVSARVYENGVYGFSSTAEYTDETVKAVLKAASENAAFLSAHAGRGKGPHPHLMPGRIVTATDLSDPEQRAYIEFIQAIDRYVAAKYPDLISRTAVAMSDSMEKLLVVSDGTDGHSILPRSYLYVTMSAAGQDGKPIELHRVIGGGYGAFTQNYDNPEACYAEIDELYERVRRKTEGVYPEAGNKTVILGGTLSGMLAHEAVGHTVEADLVIGGSVAGPNLKRVGSDLVNLVDFAHTAFGKPTPLPIYVDDEGVAATDAELIKNGILVGYMNNRESAERFGMTPNGNARAFLFIAFASEHANPEAELREHVLEMKRLIGHKRAQGIDKDARRIVRERLAGGMKMKNERLSPARCHDNERVISRSETFERLLLGIVQVMFSDERSCNMLIELIGRNSLPAGFSTLKGEAFFLFILFWVHHVEVNPADHDIDAIAAVYHTGVSNAERSRNTCVLVLSVLRRPTGNCRYGGVVLHAFVHNGGDATSKMTVEKAELRSIEKLDCYRIAVVFVKRLSHERKLYSGLERGKRRLTVFERDAHDFRVEARHLRYTRILPLLANLILEGEYLP